MGVLAKIFIIIKKSIHLKLLNRKIFFIRYFVLRAIIYKKATGQPNYEMSYGRYSQAELKN